MPTDGLITVRLAARLWSVIDAQTDHVVSLAAVDGDEAEVQTGTAIREAGWAQVPWVDGQWPPMEDLIAISLTRSQWQFAMDHLERSDASYQRIGDQESLELGRRARAAVNHS